MIKNRKHLLISDLRPTDGRILGMAVASLAAFDLARAAEPKVPEPQVMQGVTVTEELEAGGYKADTASSPKFAASLLDTPQTITVIKKELLDDQGLGSLAEALRNTPGITFTLGENGNTTAGDSITMRGFDTAGSIFLDGVRDLGAVSRDTFNTEQIEIVKGPSGSDNGRGAPTGYINMSSKQPTLQDAISSKLAFGTDNRMRGEVDLNQTLGARGGAAARFNMYYDRGDRANRDGPDFGRWGFAPSLALGLGGETRAWFNFLFTRQNNTPDGGLPVIGLLDYAYASNVAGPAIPTPTQAANVAALNTAINAAVNAAPAVDRGNFYGSLDDYEHVHANMFTAMLEHDFSATTTLRNTSRYGRTTLQRVITGVNTLGNLYAGNAAAVAAGTATINGAEVWTLSRSRQGRDEVNEILTNQSNLTSSLATAAVTHSVSTGVEFIYERQLSRGMAATGTAQAANLYSPSTADTFVSIAPNQAFTDGKTMTAAAYLFDTLKFGDHWSLNAGLRLDHYRTEFSSVPAPTTPVAATFLEGDGNLLTGKLGLVFKPVAYGTLYAAFGTSEQPPGGANFTLSATATNVNSPNLDPQKARNLEVGTKWDLLGNRLVLTAAVFDTRNRNDLAAQDPDTLVITQYGERRVRGFELGASGMVSPVWQITAGFAHMDTEVLAGTSTGNATTGAQLQYSPKVTFTSWTTYRLPFGLTIGGGARYTDSQFRNGAATQATATNLAVNPDAWVFDAMAGYAVNERISLQLNLQNLTDKFYLASLNNGGSRFVLGTPRTILLTGTARFY